MEKVKTRDMRGILFTRVSLSDGFDYDCISLSLSLDVGLYDFLRSSMSNPLQDELNIELIPQITPHIRTK